MKTIFTVAILLVASFLRSQTPTVGLLFSDEVMSDEYTLFTPEVNNSVYLINNCGELVNEWVFDEFPGNTCYLLENGTLLRAGKKSLEIRDWDNTVLWQYNLRANGINQHHDIEPLPNGNILCVVRDSYSNAEMVAQGRNPFHGQGTLDLDKIVEIKPLGTDDIEIVWEWKFIDHLVQDHDPTKQNYGQVENHPERVDINYIDPYFVERERGFTHVNSIDYHPGLDQIMISARHLNEIYIIDHSTTTIEASGHTGGNFNQGGGILWRWGNPMVYGQGGLEDQKLFLQHDAKWVAPGYLDAGKISVFNNGGDGIREYSSVHLISPEISGNNYQKENTIFQPQDFNWSWQGEILGRPVYETKKSGGHSLPNGNFIICETSMGQVSELTKTGKLVWSYKNPSGKNIFDQYESIPANSNSIFRAEKYPSDYIGFAGKDLTPKGILEDENPMSNRCAILGISSVELNQLKIINPAYHHLLQFNQHIDLDWLTIMDVNGRLVFKKQNVSGDRVRMNLIPGFYIVEFEKSRGNRRMKILVH